MPLLKRKRPDARWQRWILPGILVLALLGGVYSPPGTAREVLLETPSPQGKRTSVSVLMAIARADKRLVAVGERGIILISDDNGANWRQAKAPVSVALTNVRFVNGKKGWAIGHGGIVLHSQDGGETWVKQLDGKQAAQVELEAAKTDSSSQSPLRMAEAERLIAEGPDKPFLDVYFSDENKGLIVGAYGLAFATQDGGKTWQSRKTSIPNRKGVHLYSIHARGSDLYLAGEQGALYRSTDGGQQFIEVKTPYVGTYFGVISAPGGELVAYGLRGNVYRSADQGATWQKVDMGLPVTLSAATVLTDGSLILADETGRVLRSLDGGQKFTPVLVPQPSAFTGVTQAADGSLVLSGARGLTRLILKNQPVESKP